MKTKSLFTILAILISILAIWSGVLAVCFEKNRGGESCLILKIDKKAKGSVVAQHTFASISAVISDLSGSAFAAAGGVKLVEKCREQPVLCGGLFIFFGVSACAIGFIVHLIRTDSRF